MRDFYVSVIDDVVVSLGFQDSNKASCNSTPATSPRGQSNTDSPPAGSFSIESNHSAPTSANKKSRDAFPTSDTAAQAFLWAQTPYWWLQAEQQRGQPAP